MGRTGKAYSCPRGPRRCPSSATPNAALRLRCRDIEIACPERPQNQQTEETPMPLLQNHIAVVTGAASGIGRAIASGYAREGARVVLLDVNEKAASEVAREIRDGGGKAENFALDVIRREDCVAVAKEIADKVGQVSLLVN